MNQVIHFSLNVRTLKGFFLAALIFCTSFVYSQSALNIMDLYHESFPNKNAFIVTTNALIGDYNFHTNVGGVSFQAVASPSENISNQAVSLDFADNRLIVRIGTKVFYPNLPFWQLSSIVSFVNSPYDVIVSELGGTNNNQQAQCKFHPVFLNNLLGLRLFQADLLNQTDILWDLPVDAQRSYILAPSEQGFTPVRDSVIHKQIYEKLMSGKFTSFALTDKDVNFVFYIDDAGLEFLGTPYYYFTKTVMDVANINSLRTQLIDSYNDIESNAKLLLKEKYTPALDPRTHLNDLIKALGKYKEQSDFNPYSVYYLGQAINKVDSLNKLTDADLGIQFQTMDNFTESFKPYWSLLKKYNPVVYSAVENTAQWSAFFRYVSKVNPDNWSQFANKVQTGTWDAPAIQTPTSTDINYFRYFDDKEKGKR